MENEEIIDKRVLSYITRAYNMLNNDIFAKHDFSIDITLEIAQIIQKEEFRNNGLYFKD